MAKKSNQKPSRTRADCGSCGGERNCDILGHHSERGDDHYLQWSKDWHILRCCGCNHVFAQTVYGDSESMTHYYDEYGEEQVEYDETKNYWPALSKRQQPAWLTLLSGHRGERASLRDALTETYGALEGDLHTLASIGIRTSFDVAAELLEIDSAIPFAQKLDGLVDAGHIGKVDRSRLEALVEAGSASAHRGWRPSASDVEVMMDALEHFIHSAFVAPEEKKALDAKIAAMKGNVPGRQKRAAKKENAENADNKA